MKVDGKVARELMWSGGLPSPAADVDRLVLGLSLPGIEVAAPKVRYELSFTLDRDSQRIGAIVARGWKEPGDAGEVGVEFGLANPDDARKLDEIERARGKDKDADQPSIVMQLALRDFDTARLQVPDVFNRARFEKDATLLGSWPPHPIDLAIGERRLGARRARRLAG